MSDFLSLSLFQLLSVISFLTSVIAVLRLGPGSLHRFSHKYEPQVATSAEMGVGADKSTSWSWSMAGLPVSFSLSTLIGDEETGQDTEDDLENLSGVTSPSQVVRMHWQQGKLRNATPFQLSQPPISMAKLIMSRHSQRKPYRIPRHTPGMPRPTPPSRLMGSVV